jgi:hypothetical protein
MSMRKYFSIQHVQSAALFTSLAYETEKSYNGVFSEDITSKHTAYVTGGILFSVFALEAFINEFFSDATEENSRLSKELDNDTINLLSQMWIHGVPRTANFPIIRKFQIALTLCKKDQFDLGISPYQDVNCLIGLRNSLVHYEPETIKLPDSDDFDDSDIHKYERQLSGKFALNPITGAGNAFYPDKCLSHGCAEWAVISCSKVISEFMVRTGTGTGMSQFYQNPVTRTNL